MKKFLVALSVSYFLYGVIMFLFVILRIREVVYSILSNPEIDFLNLIDLPTISFILIGVFFSSLSCWLGYLLFKLKKRRTVIVLTCVLLLGLPIGTALGIVTLCILSVKEIKNAFNS